MTASRWLARLLVCACACRADLEAYTGAEPAASRSTTYAVALRQKGAPALAPMVYSSRSPDKDLQNIHAGIFCSLHGGWFCNRTISWVEFGQGPSDETEVTVSLLAPLSIADITTARILPSSYGISPTVSTAGDRVTFRVSGHVKHLSLEWGRRCVDGCFQRPAWLACWIRPNPVSAAEPAAPPQVGAGPSHFLHARPVHFRQHPRPTGPEPTPCQWRGQRDGRCADGRRHPLLCPRGPSHRRPPRNLPAAPERAHSAPRARRLGRGAHQRHRLAWRGRGAAVARPSQRGGARPDERRAVPVQRRAGAAGC